MSKNTKTTVTPGTTEVRALVRKASGLFARAGKVTRDARIAGATATHAVYAAGLIGSKRDGKYGWDTAVDYAATLGVSKTDVAILRSAGVALSVGFDPNGEDSARWGVLSSKGATAPVTAVTVKADKPNLSEIRDVLDKIAAGNTSPNKADGSRAGDAGDDTRATDEGSRGLDLPRSHKALLDVIEAALAKMDHGKVTPAEYKRLAGIAETIDGMRATRESGKRSA